MAVRPATAALRRRESLLAGVPRPERRLRTTARLNCLGCIEAANLPAVRRGGAGGVRVWSSLNGSLLPTGVRHAAGATDASAARAAAAYQAAQRAAGAVADDPLCRAGAAVSRVGTRRVAAAAAALLRAHRSVPRGRSRRRGRAED